MNQRVGTCSICGGNVMGFRGVWMSILPPPSDRCAGCGAVAKGDVIEMVRPRWGQVDRPYPTTAGPNHFIFESTEGTNAG